MSADTAHLVALVARLGDERARLAQATRPKEIALRKVWVAQIEREIREEETFLGLDPAQRSYRYSVGQGDDDDAFYVVRDELEVVGLAYPSRESAQARADELEAAACELSDADLLAELLAP